MAYPARGAQGPIQRAFTGLIGLLDLSGSEVTPNTIAGFVQPTLDTLPFLFAGIGQSQSIATAFGNVPNSSFFSAALSVPSGSAWLVRAITATWDVQPTETLRQFGVAIRSPSQQALTLNTLIGNWGTAAAVDRAFCSWEGLLVLPAGWTFGASWGGYAGLGSPGTVSVLASQVRS